MTRPEHIVGRKGCLTPDQVRCYRARYRRRAQLLAELNGLSSIRQMAEEAGLSESAMKQLISGRSYGWVR